MTSKTFYYGRVSATDQNLQRQIDAFAAMGAEERDMYLDKASGKNFARPEYERMIGNLREGDTVVIMSIDRLGRNYDGILEQWKKITNELNCYIKVLDMPLLDTTTRTLDGKLIADIVLQLLAYVAEKERANIRSRQAQGMAAEIQGADGKRYSIRTGNKHGRPSAEYPPTWNEITAQWKAGDITATEAIKRLEIPRATFYRLAAKSGLIQKEA